MFELLLTACLTASPDICAERLAPPAFESEAACAAGRAERAEAWIAARAGLAITAARCVAQTALARAIPPLEVVEVADGVFVHEGRYEVPSEQNAGDIANLGFVIGAEAVAVIDAGGSRAVGEGLYAAIRSRTDLPIRWLVLTHMHPDHTLGASVFQEAGAEVIGHPKLPAALAARADTYTENFRRLIGERAFLGSVIVAPADDGRGGVTPDQERALDLGGRRLILRAHATAHTDNDLSALDEKTGVWFSGDLVFVRHTPALDGSIRGWISLLEELPTWRGARPSRIAPGHGPVSLPWPEGATPTRDYLRALAAETREAIRRGESMRAAIEHLGESQRAHWRLFDEYNPRNATTAYKELEWE